MNLRPVKSVGGPSSELNTKWDKLYEDAHKLRAERIAELDIPPVDRMPVQDMVVVYRIPNVYKGAIQLLGDNVHDSPYSVGVFIAAGPEAMDVLESHGVMPGDLVTFARYAGEEVLSSKIQEAVAGLSDRAAKTVADGMIKESQAEKKILKLQVPAIHESIDLFGRLYGETPTMAMVRLVDKNGNATHVIQPV